MLHSRALDQGPRYDASRSNSSSASFPWKLSIYPFSKGRAEDDERRLHIDLLQPIADRLGGELAAIIAGDILGHAPRRHQPHSPFSPVGLTSALPQIQIGHA